MSIFSRRRQDHKQDDTLSRRHRPDYQIILFTGLLMLLGLIVMYAIGPARAHVLNEAYGTDYYTDTHFFIKQAFSLIVALAAFAFMAVLPHKLLEKYAVKILIVGFVACAVLAVAGWIGLGIAQCSLGACRWFDLGPLGSLQPSEFLKIGMLLFVAGFLGVRSKQGLVNDFNKTLIPVGVVILIAVLFVIIIQRDMGTGLAMLVMLASMFVMAGLKYRTMGIVGLVGILMIILMILIAPHRLERISTFFEGDTASLQDPSNYHIVHAKIAIGTGGFLGVGIGNSVQATGYLPEAINDSVFAIMGETFGFVGLAVVLLIFTALLMQLLVVADRLEDMRAKLIVAGIFGWLGAHVVLNVASMTGIFPLTGITLPLLSFGGTSMVFMAAALGLAFQLSRYTSYKPTTKETGYENSGSRRRFRGTRNPSRRRIT